MGLAVFFLFLAPSQGCPRTTVLRVRLGPAEARADHAHLDEIAGVGAG